MYDIPLTTGKILTPLAATPTRIADLTKEMAPDLCLAVAKPGQWLARDVLAHLRSCSDIWGGYIVKILNEDRPTFKAINPTTWIKKRITVNLIFMPRCSLIQRSELNY